MSRCVITFENSPDGVYYNGQLLRGTVVLTTVEPKTISRMHIEALGYSRVRWRGRKKSDKGQTTPAILYTGEEQYLQSKTYVVGNATNENETDVLPAGTHTYTFEIPLPKDLPSSFMGKVGYIRYEVIFTIESCQGVIDSFKQPFSVVETLNLNEHPKHKKPIFETETKMVDFCFCWNEIINASCYIPFSGFVAGQKIPLTIKIENKANYQCFGSRLKLERVVKFKSKLPNEETTKETASLSQKQLRRVALYSTSEYNEFLEVPSTPPSSTRKDRQIDVSYFVSLYIHGAGNRSFEVRFPVTIGTEPLHGDEFQEVPPENREEESQSTIPCTQTLTLDAPPSYTEATAVESESVDNDTVFDDSVDSPYTPKYPFYNDLPLPTAPPMDEVLKEFEKSDSDSKSKKYGWIF